MLPAATADLRVAQRDRLVALLVAVRAQWSLMGPDLDASWRRVGPRITALTTAAMVGAAGDAAASVPAALAQTGHPATPLLQINAAAFAAANLTPYGDGSGAMVPLDRHLYGAVIRARTANVTSLPERLQVGGQTLDRIVHTQVSEATKAAASVTVAATPRVGWIRYVSPPCCQDCAVQAGRWFRYNEGFDRHPNCDCVHRPAHENEPPEGYTQDVPTDAIKDLTVGQRLALEDGADLSQVVNAYRTDTWRKTGPVDYTVEGTTRRGWHSYVQRELARQREETLTWTASAPRQQGAVSGYRTRRTGPRPTPDAIYRFADSREEALRLLAANGYVVGDLRSVARAALGG